MQKTTNLCSKRQKKQTNKQHDGSTNPVKDSYARKPKGYHIANRLREFMLGTYFVWVHVGSSSLVWAHLGSSSSERSYLPGQGRPESKIVPNDIVFMHFEHSVEQFSRILSIARSGVQRISTWTRARYAYNSFQFSL